MAQTLQGDAASTMQATGTPNGPSNVTGFGPNATTEMNRTNGGLVTDKTTLSTWVLDSLQRMRNFRRPYDQRRAYFYRQYIGQRDRRMFPDNLTPRSNTFVPYPQSNVDAIVGRVHDAFFSVEEWIEARPKGGSPEQAWQMQQVMLTLMKKAQAIKAIELLTRDCGIYGHCGLKVDWDWDYDVVTGPEPMYQMQPVLDNQGQPIQKFDADGNPTGEQVQMPVMGQDGNPIQIGTNLVSKRVPRNCPKFIPIDIYDLLLDPDGKQKAHVMELSWGEMCRSYESNPKLYYPEAMADLTQKLSQYRKEDRDGIIIRMAEFWDDTNKTTTLVTFGEDADAIGWKDRRYQYRNASYSAYKRRVYNGPPVLLYTGPNPFAHKRIPILDLAYKPVKGDAYGIGLIETISDLCEGINVFVNMITDNWNLGINKRYAYDVQADIDHEQLRMGNSPGGLVGVVGNPSNIIMPIETYTPAQQDYMIVDLYKNMVEMGSGIDDFYGKGVGASGSNDTASGISQIISQSGYVFKLFIRRMELEILQPMCEMVASMIQQFGSEEVEYSITNAPPGIPKWGRVSLENLLGFYEFDFVCANYATGKATKQRNLMAFYNLAQQSPYCNQGEFLREIGRSLDLPFMNRLLKTDDQVSQESQSATQARQQEELVKELLKMEGKAFVEQLKKPEFMPMGSVKTNSPNVAHGQAIQGQVEQYLGDVVESVMGFAPPPTTPPIHPVGKPRSANLNGPLPGGAAQDSERSEAQSMGKNGTGVGGFNG